VRVWSQVALKFDRGVESSSCLNCLKLQHHTLDYKQISLASRNFPLDRLQTAYTRTCTVFTIMCQTADELNTSENTTYFYKYEISEKNTLTM